MPSRLKEYYDKLLGLQGETSKDAFTVEYQSGGPGEYDPWLKMEGKEDSWRVLTSASLKPKQTGIIYCVGLSDEDAPSSEALTLIRDLIHYYPFGFYHGSKAKLTDAKLITQSSEFWKTRHSVPYSSPSEIKQCLKDQGIAAEDYIILDAAEMQRLVSRAQRSEHSDVLDLTEYNLADDEDVRKIKASYQGSSFKKIKINTPSLLLKIPVIQNMKEVISLFPHLGALEVVNVSSDAIICYLKHIIASENIDIEFCFNEDRMCIIHEPAARKIKSLTIKYGKQLQYVEVGSAEIGKLTLIGNDHLTSCVMAAESKVDSLEVIDCNQFELIEGECLVKEFCVKRSVAGEPQESGLLDLTQLKYLKSFSCKDVGYSEIRFPSVTENKDEHTKENKEFYFRVMDCPYLKELNLSHWRTYVMFDQIKVWDCRSLTSIALYPLGRIDALEVASCPISSLNFNGDNLHISSLDLSYCYQLSKLDFAQLKTLKRLNLRSCYKLTEVIGLNRFAYSCQLSVSDCEMLSPISFPELNNISAASDMVEMRNNADLVELKDSKDYQKIKSLFVGQCENLETIDFAGLTELTSFILRDCDKARFVKLVANEKLRKIEIDNGPEDRVIWLEGLSHVSELSIEELKTGTQLKLPDARIDHLRLESSHVIYNGRGLSEIAEIKSLNLQKIMFNFDNFNENCRYSIKKLELEGVWLSEAESLRSLDRLTQLTMRDVVVSMFNWRNEALEVFHAVDTHLIKEGKFDFSRLVELRKIKLIKCSIKKIDVSSLTKLNSLTIDASFIEFLGNFSCQSFNSLVLASNSLLERVDLSSIEELREFKLNACPKIEKFTWSKGVIGSVELLSMPSLNVILGSMNDRVIESLEVIDCGGADGGISFNENTVRRVVLQNCGLIRKLDLSKLKGVEEVIIEDCSDLEEIILPEDGALILLKIKGCRLIKDLSFKECREIEEIIIEECGIDCSLNFNGSLNLEGLKKLRSIDFLLRSTGKVIIRNCKRLKMLVVRCQDESRILLNGCHQLQRVLAYTSSNLSINGLEDATKLKYLQCETSQVEELKRTLPSSLPKDCVVEISEPKKISDDVSREEKPEEKKETSAHDQSLNRQNARSLVSSYSQIQGSVRTDNETGDAAPYKAPNDLKVRLYTKDDAITANHYRINVFSRIKYEKGEVCFSPSVNPLTEIKIEQKSSLNDQAIFEKIDSLRNDPNGIVGFFEGALEKNEYYYLPTLQTVENQEVELYCDPGNGVRVFWDKEYQQHCIQLASDAPSGQEVKVLYKLKQNKNYDQASQDEKIAIKDPEELLGPELIKDLRIKLKDLFEKNGPLAFLDAKLTVEEKISRLIEYSQDPAFKMMKLSKSDNSDLDILCDVIREQKGVCRHRSQAFTLLAQLIGVEAHLVYNAKHAYCEIPYHSKEAISYRRCDLGGAPLLDLTPLKQKKDVLDRIHKKLRDEKPAIEVEDKKSYVRRRIGEHYSQEFKAAVTPTELKTIMPLVKEDQLLVPLIQLSPSNTPLTMNKRIIDELNLNGFDSFHQHVYIHSPADFALYFNPPVIDGKPEQSPLKHILEKGGVIVVNWSNFSPVEMVVYKTILDAEPAIFDQAFDPKKVKVIGLMQGEMTDHSTLSRCKPWLPKLDELKLDEKTTEIKEVKEAKVVNLFNNPSWRKKLFGDIEFKGNRKTLIKGPLIEAILANQPFVIQNPPDDEALKLLLYRIQSEGKILFNGKLIKIPPGFSIKTEIKPYAGLSSNINFVELNLETKGLEAKSESKIPALSRINLGLYNLHECQSRLKIANDKTAGTYPSLLESYQPGKEVFYVTEDIPVSLWQELSSYIREEFPSKKFIFELAPGVKVGDIKKNSALLKEVVMDSFAAIECNRSSVILSNDTDYVVKQLIRDEKNSLVIHPTSQTTYNEIVTNTKDQQKKSDQLTVEFSYKEGALLKALEEGRAVILNGDISHAFYQRLLPFLASPTTLELNGRVVALTGKLIIVMPRHAENKFPILDCKKYNFKFSDYQQLFLKENKECERDLAAIKHFCDWAKKLPHRGKSMPTEINFTYSRLANMLSVLQSKEALHSHNPIKGLFHYDYHPKYGENYSYLSVLGKYFLKPQDPFKVRGYKLKKLLSRIDLSSDEEIKKHLWRLLNCFSGHDLHEILGEKLDLSICYPTLSLEAFEHFKKRLAEFQKQPEQLEKKEHDCVEKPLRQLSKLLSDETKSIIILKGLPGIGKTHTARNLIGKCYEGDDEIEAWVKEGGVFLIDEGNQYQPGTWDFLKGLTYDPKTIFYKGKEYKGLTSKHKVIITANPEDFPGRFYDPLYQQHGEIIQFQMPSLSYLESKILKPNLIQHNLYEPGYVKGLLSVHKLIEKYVPFFTIGIRELENLTKRFILLAKNASLDPARKQALFDACMGEFSAMIKNQKDRQQFKIELAKTLDINLVEEKKTEKFIPVGNIVIPVEKKYLVDALRQDLLMRREMLAELKSQKSSSSSLYYKKAIFLQGEVGLGKSTLLKEIIASEEKTKPYIISAGTKNAHEILMRAFHEGAMVILDEINVDESMERLLIQLLDGFDINKHPPKNPGFMVLATGNFSSDKGRKTESHALRSRMHVMYMDNFSKEELEVLARKKPEPDVFVSTYNKQVKETKGVTSVRTFFTVMEKGKMPDVKSYEEEWKQKNRG